MDEQYWSIIWFEYIVQFGVFSNIFMNQVGIV